MTPELKETIDRIKSYLTMLNSKDIESRFLAINLIKNDQEVCKLCLFGDNPKRFLTYDYVKGPMLGLKFALKHPRLYDYNN